MVKRNNRRGFTIAELLIVVAIIAVLVAIAIPVFGNILERSRESTDAANIRSSYAEAVAELLAMSPSDQAKKKDAANVLSANTFYTIQQQKKGWEPKPEFTGPLSDFAATEMNKGTAGTYNGKGDIVASEKDVIRVSVYMNGGEIAVAGITGSK